MKTTPSIAKRSMIGLLCSIALISCKPTVKVEAPEKPITINMNIKIDHEIRVRLDKDIENMLDERTDIF
ncbi:YnbE family lipoprotein [Prosthecochloris sp. SCSIO W1103]|uniref:YnbE family lipoprotein n=1 Tax=Prosthecochloris sp. SCSIO W1103 TaxID=2992244 RepID=UPI00223CBF37|nr:YnbE family lipoprotein [Prosthecochloris sp. SCSIO W1103]UZJ38825.1 YnbE family lipoprotein [Prosthecochloris sp. SCSIO W1103]